MHFFVSWAAVAALALTGSAFGTATSGAEAATPSVSPASTWLPAAVTTETALSAASRIKKVKNKTGKLTITVSGVPTGITAAVKITGPKKYTKTVTKSVTLKKLRLGTYVVAPKPFIRSGQAATFLVSSNRVKVKAGKTRTVIVNYAWRPPTTPTSPTPTPPPPVPAAPGPPAPTVPVTPSPPTSPPPPGSGTGAITRVSTAADGNQADSSSDDPVMSPDGTRIAFASHAANLVPGDTNDRRDLFVKTLATGAIQRISTAADGTQGDDSLFDKPVWSPDGTRIAFASLAANLVPGDTNQTGDVFVKTLATGAIQRVSTDKDGNQAVGWMYDRTGEPAWSPDGTRLAFISDAANLVPGDTNGRVPGLDVFVKTLATGAIERVSTDKDGNQAVDSSREPAWSPDSTRLAFTSAAANLVSGDTNEIGDVFIKTLATGAIQRVSTDKDGNQAVGGEFTLEPTWSPDASRLAFISDAANLVPGDTNETGDVFVKTLATGAIQQVSTDKDGNQIGGGEVFTYGVVWSPDSTRLAFSSYAADLVPGDTNETGDVFVKTLATGAIQRVSTDKDGNQANDDSHTSTWFPDGLHIAFASYAANLVPGDTNESGDVFIKPLP